jgi:hypothetical protein
MKTRANLQLSAEESSLMMDTRWILTKNSVMGKVVGMMAGLSDAYREIWAGADPGAGGGGGVSLGDPKISRGENYRGLPWVMLDYPRVFGREDVLAIRTMFWWGHAFSVTLHLKGKYQERWMPVIARRRAQLIGANFFVGVGPDEWRHEVVPENYLPMGDVEPGGVGEPSGTGAGPSFLKLTATVGLDRWAEAHEELLRLYTLLVGVLCEPTGH